MQLVSCWNYNFNTVSLQYKNAQPAQITSKLDDLSSASLSQKKRAEYYRIR
jgi:hypothetical protein